MMMTSTCSAVMRMMASAVLCVGVGASLWELLLH
jgi:hypothetical protein